MLLAGTSDGVYRAPTRPFETADCVLAGPTVRQLRARGPVVLAATDEGLFRTTDGGASWRNLGLPVGDVYSVLSGEQRLYAGVQPAGILVSADGGTWDRQARFERLAAGADWPTNPHHEQACVRSLAATGGVLLAGVEVGGLAVSRDGGGTWGMVRAVPDDVHHVLPVTDERWVVSCGTGGPDGEGGVFETRDGGETWTRRDTGPYRYVRESCHHERLYTAGNRTAPLWTPPDAALFVERAGQNDERTLEPVQYPGEPAAFVLSWTVLDDGVLAGTNDGRLVRGRDDEWRELGRVPVSEDDQRAFGVRSLAVV